MPSTEPSKPLPPKKSLGHVSGSVIYYSETDIFLFDTLPNRVRKAFRESPYEFSAEQIFDIFRQIRMYTFSDAEAWDEILRVLPRDIADLAAAERRMYRELSVGIREK